MCGIFGVYGHSEAANITYLGLHALQHRGQEAAGITTSDGDRLRTERRVVLSPDAHGWAPDQGQLDLFGKEIPQNLYTTRDFERVVSLLTRTEAAAKHRRYPHAFFVTTGGVVLGPTFVRTPAQLLACV